MSGLFEIIAGLLAWLYGHVHSYGLAVVLLTLIVMAVTTPLTYKGTKSMLEMQALQPQLKAIQQRYRNDREKMNQELMSFYKEHNINPIGGCLPLLIQAPVFIILFRVVDGLRRRVTNIGLQAGLTATQVAGGATLSVAEEPLRNFNPGYISKSSELYQDLAQTNRMKSWGLDMSESASDALRNSIGHALPYLGLIAAVLVTGVIQQRQISKRSAGAQINPQQQMIMKVMPIFLPVFSFAMPAALVVYFVVSNLWRIGQQAYITHKLYSGEDSLGKRVAAAREAAEKAATEEPEPEPKKKQKDAKDAKADEGEAASEPGGRAGRNVMGRNRAGSGGVGRRLPEFNEPKSNGKSNGRGSRSPKNENSGDAKQPGKGASSSRFQSGRVTRKTDGPEKGKK